MTSSLRHVPNGLYARFGYRGTAIGRPCSLQTARLLNSPSLVAIGLLLGYETWPPIGWHRTFVIGWSKYRMGLHRAPLHYGIISPVGIPTVFQTPWQSLCTALTAGKCLPLGLWKGTVKQSSKQHLIKQPRDDRAVTSQEARQGPQWTNSQEDSIRPGQSINSITEIQQRSVTTWW